MRKREFNNVLSLRGAYLYATWQTQQNKIIGRDPHVSPLDFLRMTILKIGSSLEFFSLQKIGVTSFKQGMTFIMGILISSMSMTGTVKAECTPTPDCASIGYTASSCDGGFVRCPFDTSKLFCMPCDTKYKYTCSGNNIIGGVGTSCNGKYISCECSNGGVFTNGECPQSCTVGMIYYSDKSCSSAYNSSKTAIGVVVKENELVMSKKSSSDMTWGTYGTDVRGVTNTSTSTAQTDMNGKSNTLAIIAGDSGAVAAKYCNSYKTTGTSAGDWYLPAAGELYSYVYGNYSTINATMTTLGWLWGNFYLWSSSENDSFYAWDVYSGVGVDVSIYDKYVSNPVVCFLSVSLIA